MSSESLLRDFTLCITCERVSTLTARPIMTGTCISRLPVVRNSEKHYRSQYCRSMTALAGFCGQVQDSQTGNLVWGMYIQERMWDADSCCLSCDDNWIRARDYIPASYNQSGGQTLCMYAQQKSDGSWVTQQNSTFQAACVDINADGFRRGASLVACMQYMLQLLKCFLACEGATH